MFVQISDRIIVNTKNIVELTLNKDDSQAWLKCEYEQGRVVRRYKISKQEFFDLSFKLTTLSQTKIEE